MSRAKQIVSKIATGMSKADAEKLLAKFDTVEAATALKGPERQEYLDALDVVYGDRAKRAKDLGFSDETYYHGTKSDFDSVDPQQLGSSTKAESAKQAFFATDNPEVAGRFGYIAPTEAGRDYERLSNLYEEKFRAGKSEESKEMKELLKQVNAASNKVMNGASPGIGGKLTDVEARTMPLRFKEPNNVIDRGGGGIWGDRPSSESIQDGTNLFKNAIDDPHMKAKQASNIIATTDPSAVRSTNAAFDPRFKDSANILAIAGQQAPKLINKMVPKPDMGLSSAFSTINEPLEKLNAPRNRAIEIASQIMGKQLDISGGKVPGMAEQNADILHTVADFAVPTSQDLAMGPVGRAVKGMSTARTIAGKIKPTAAEVLRDTVPNITKTAVVPTAEQIAGHGKVSVQNAKDFFNPSPHDYGKVKVKP